MHPGFSESCDLQGIFKRIGDITGRNRKRQPISSPPVCWTS